MTVRWEYSVEAVPFSAGPDGVTQFLNEGAANGWEVVSVVPHHTETEQRGKGGFQSVSGGGTLGRETVTSVWIFFRRPAPPPPPPPG